MVLGDELDGVLQERCVAGWKEREVRMSLLSIIRPQAAGNIEAKWHLAVELPKLPLQFYASHRAGWYPCLNVRSAVGGMAPPSLLLSPL